jgi:hypothetical protein
MPETLADLLLGYGAWDLELRLASLDTEKLDRLLTMV